MGKLNQDPSVEGPISTKNENGEGVEEFVEFPKRGEKPAFSIQDVRASIPKHCWERNTFKSITYFIRDYAQIIITFSIFHFYVFPNISSGILFFFAWIAYSLIQGSFMWGLFVCGHDCGHRSFCPNDTVNNIFGELCHIPILVPFHSWRLSHGLHHKNHGNVERDEAFSAVTQADYDNMLPGVRIFRYHAYLIGGWTLYLIYGMPSHFNSHFSFKSDLYLKSSPADQKLMRQSIYLFWIFFLNLVIVVPYFFGYSFLLTYYVGAYFVFGFWISLVTHLHHTHPDAPWYRAEEWDYQRGALTTINRDYGIIEHIHHNVGTHTVHHYFSRIPHYNLREADRAIKPVLGDYYKRSDVSAFETIKLVWNTCRFVPDEGNVVYYQGPSKKNE